MSLSMSPLIQPQSICSLSSSMRCFEIELSYVMFDTDIHHMLLLLKKPCYFLSWKGIPACHAEYERDWDCQVLAFLVLSSRCPHPCLLCLLLVSGWETARQISKEMVGGHIKRDGSIPTLILDHSTPLKRESIWSSLSACCPFSAPLSIICYARPLPYTFHNQCL